MSPKETTAVLKRMPETLQKHVAGLMEAQLRFQPEGGYFSVLENVYRLRGIEIEGYGVGCNTCAWKNTCRRNPRTDASARQRYGDFLQRQHHFGAGAAQPDG